MFFSYFPISSRRQELWLVHFFLSFPGLAEVLSQGIYLLNKWLRNWIVGDTVAPQGAIKPGPFFFFNTIQKYCQHIVIDSENLFPEFYLLKLRNLIRAIDIHGDKSQSSKVLTKSHSLYPTCGLLSRGSAFLTVSGFACSVLFLFSMQILSHVFTPFFFLLSGPGNLYFLLSMKDEDLVQVHVPLPAPLSIGCMLKLTFSWMPSSTAHSQVLLSPPSSHQCRSLQLHKVRAWVFPLIFPSASVGSPLSLYPDALTSLSPAQQAPT